MKRCLIINYEYPPVGGGAATASANLAAEMARRGTEVVVITSRYRDLPRVEREGRLTVMRVEACRRRLERSNPVEMMVFMCSAIPAALRLTRTWKPDFTIAFFGIPGGPVAHAVNRRHGIPYIVSLRGGDVPGHIPERLGCYHRLTRPWIRRIWKRAAAVVANSEGLRRLALQTAPGQAVSVIPTGVDCRRFQPPAGGRKPRSTRLELLCVGRLTYEKGLQHLLPALATLDTIDWRLRIVGDGPFSHEVRRLVAMQKLTPRVEFEGWQSGQALVDLYGNADIYVLASLHEAMPNTVLEAMACATPIVATRVWGCEDLLEDGTTALLVPPGESNALADAIRRLAADPELAARLGDAARQYAEINLTWAAATDAYLGLMAP